jgi:hypothetical protein
MRKYRPWIHYTEADKALMWDRWQQVESCMPLPDYSIGITIPCDASWPRRAAFVHHRADVPDSP